ncbi:hypothetical protein [Dysgonomonas sp. 521]|uniref:hypothetical protein n=1 Tax=Dysgonomonas sp. 521 TaxID=2302932 RepID=UPI002104FDE2|nr:hypothetical protein [Dysgonomonas sp. 521]
MTFSLLSCSKDESLNTVPAEPVHFEVSLIKSPDKNLRTPNNSETFTQPRLSTDRVGYSGLLVICSAVPITSTTYQLYAYDLCCPNEKRRDIRVAAQGDGTAKCPQCGSVFEIFNGVGNVKSGPSKDGLQIYYAQFYNTGDGVFLITRRN